MARRALGIAGEDAAAAWYEANGYEVVSSNWRCREGELDLVVRRNRTIVFCEVKARSSDAFGVPAEAVNHLKRQKLRVLAAKWIEDSPIRPREIRFDVVSVLGSSVEVIEGAF
ncbi:MAG TPA: YraN family protein [Acidimicrobiales bacterium]|jgi:putative endonuclease|nr:YraN family protein [Acidimicrobiales bacterium]